MQWVIHLNQGQELQSFVYLTKGHQRSDEVLKDHCIIPLILIKGC